jgi:hypothetical protein
MDSEDGEPDDEICNDNLGRDIVRAVQRNDTKPVKKVSIGRSPQTSESSNDYFGRGADTGELVFEAFLENFLIDCWSMSHCGANRTT